MNQEQLFIIACASIAVCGWVIFRVTKEPYQESEFSSTNVYGL